MDLIIWVAILYLLYLYNQHKLLVTSTISALPSGTPIGGPILPAQPNSPNTALVPNNTQGATLPSKAVMNPDGSISLAGGTLLPVPDVNNPLYGGEFDPLFGAGALPTNWQYMPNNQPSNLLTSTSS